MPIVCASDLGPISDSIALFSARLAARLRTRLILVHAVEPAGSDDEAQNDPAYAPARERLAAIAGRLRGEGVPVEQRLHAGAAGAVVPAVANAVRARVVVVASGPPVTGLQRLVGGGTALHTIADSRSPVLVVRRTADLAQWIAGDGGLPVLLALAHDDAETPAVSLLAQFAAAAPCTVRAVRVVRPAFEHQRLGLHEAPSEGLHGEAQAVVRRELEQAISGLPGAGATELAVVASDDRADAVLLRLAAERPTGLVVLGAGHAGPWSGGSWGGDVARRVVQSLPGNVLLVPPLRLDSPELPAVRAALVPVLTADEAPVVAWACSTIAPGGTIHLLAVVEPAPVRGFIRAASASDPEGRPADLPEVHAWLRRLAPTAADGRQVTVATHVCWGRDPAGVAAAVAERIGVDVICVDGGTPRRAPAIRPTHLIDRTSRTVLVVKSP